MELLFSHVMFTFISATREALLLLEWILPASQKEYLKKILVKGYLRIIPNTMLDIYHLMKLKCFDTQKRTKVWNLLKRWLFLLPQ